jgi:F0F1-type ATP synthase assembly protein I
MQRTYQLSLGISVVVAAIVLAGWAGFISEWTSAPTLGWIGVVAIALIAVFLLNLRAARPTHSVAKTLYDAEQPRQRSL